jgi:hypothetical protein
METAYRLGEHKIIEYSFNEIRWESHFGMGAFQTGRCFRKGSILFIGPSENVQAGFLKGEFLDHLDTLPVWLKTKYYYKGCEVNHCETGNKVVRNEMLSWMLEKPIEEDISFQEGSSAENSSNTICMKKKENVAFRLQRYEIVTKPRDRVVWKKSAGPKTVFMGNCLVLEDILFIEAFQGEQFAINKDTFLANLRKLPQWNQTRYFCSKLSLLECKSGSRVRKRGKQNDKKSSSEKHQSITIPIGMAKIEVPKDTGQRDISVKALKPFEFFLKSTTSHKERLHNFWLKSKVSNISKHILCLNVKQWFIGVIAIILLTVALVFAVFVGYWNEHQERSFHEKSKHRSNHHRDH